MQRKGIDFEIKSTFVSSVILTFGIHDHIFLKSSIIVPQFVAFPAYCFLFYYLRPLGYFPICKLLFHYFHTFIFFNCLIFPFLYFLILPGILPGLLGLYFCYFWGFFSVFFLLQRYFPMILLLRLLLFYLVHVCSGCLFWIVTSLRFLLSF